MRILSRDNPKIKEITKLISSGKFRREKGLFVIEGERICTDALLSGICIETLVYSDRGQDKYPDSIAALRKVCKSELSVDDGLFEKIADTKNPQGVLCVCRINNARLAVAEISAGKRYIALENLSDPANLGTIARTAEALGIDGIILSEGSCDPYSPKALRAGMGSMLRIPLVMTDNFISFITKLKSDGVRIFSAVPARDALPVTDANLSGGGIMMIGNEGNGLTEAAKVIGNCVTIPMAGRAESLNAAAAAAIMMWEMCR